MPAGTWEQSVNDYFCILNGNLSSISRSDLMCPVASLTLNTSGASGFTGESVLAPALCEGSGPTTGGPLSRRANLTRPL